MKKRLSSSDRKYWKEGEEINPMDGLANLSDAMLCLAVGIMLALITHWNVDVVSGVVVDPSQMREVDQKQVQEVQRSQVESDDSGKGNVKRYGQVYRDEETGKIYIIED